MTVPNNVAVGQSGHVTAHNTIAARVNELETKYLQQTTASSTYVPKGLDGFVKQLHQRGPRVPLRLSAPVWALTLPKWRAINTPTSTNTRDVVFTADGSSPFLVHGSTAYETNKYGLTGYVGASNPGGIWAPPIEVEFITDASEISMKLTTGNTAFQVLCNGELIYDGANAPTGGSWIIADWNGVQRLRHYRLRSPGLAVHSIRVGASNTVLAPTDDLGPKVAIVGDSYSQNSGRNNIDIFPRMIGSLLGWRRLMVNADGGTGYGQDNGTTTQTFLERVPQIVASDPDLILWIGGHNTSAAEQTDGFDGLRQSAEAVFSQTRTSLPNVPMIAIGPLSQSSTFQTNNNASWDKLAAACAAYDVEFIDNRGWVTGTGYDTAPAYDGNADVVTSSDGTHYTAFGAELVAYRIASAIADL